MPPVWVNEARQELRLGEEWLGPDNALVCRCMREMRGNNQLESCDGVTYLAYLDEGPPELWIFLCSGGYSQCLPGFLVS